MYINTYIILWTLSTLLLYKYETYRDFQTLSNFGHFGDFPDVMITGHIYYSNKINLFFLYQFNDIDIYLIYLINLDKLTIEIVSFYLYNFDT